METRSFAVVIIHHKSLFKESNIVSKPFKSSYPPSGASIKALLIYDDFASAVKANMALQRVSEQADLSVLWNIRPWCVDVLRLLPAADKALNEAIDAHLIVFAGNRAQSNPSWLQRWLEQWATCRSINDAALAVIADGGQQTLSSSVSSGITEFARRHKLEIIFNDRGALKNEAAVFIRRVIPYRNPARMGHYGSV